MIGNLNYSIKRLGAEGQTKQSFTALPYFSKPVGSRLIRRNIWPKLQYGHEIMSRRYTTLHTKCFLGCAQ